MASGPPVKRLKQSLLCFTSSKSSSTGISQFPFFSASVASWDRTTAAHLSNCRRAMSTISKFSLAT